MLASPAPAGSATHCSGMHPSSVCPVRPSSSRWQVSAPSLHDRIHPRHLRCTQRRRPVTFASYGVPRLGYCCGRSQPGRRRLHILDGTREPGPAGRHPSCSLPWPSYATGKRITRSCGTQSTARAAGYWRKDRRQTRVHRLASSAGRCAGVLGSRGGDRIPVTEDSAAGMGCRPSCLLQPSGWPRRPQRESSASAREARQTGERPRSGGCRALAAARPQRDSRSRQLNYRKAAQKALRERLGCLAGRQSGGVQVGCIPSRLEDDGAHAGLLPLVAYCHEC